MKFVRDFLLEFIVSMVSDLFVQKYIDCRRTNVFLQFSFLQEQLRIFATGKHFVEFTLSDSEGTQSEFMKPFAEYLCIGF